MTSWRFATRSDVGLVRDGNEDAAYAGPRLLVVADGVGGSVAGEIASNIAITSLAPLDTDDQITNPLDALNTATRHANDEVRAAIEDDPSLAGMGTTLTAMLWSGETLGLAQLGDSRAYLLRDGRLTQITRDQTLVQSLVDEGQITAEDALTHPRRSWILRALDGRVESHPDLEVLTTEPADRYLLCSDGLSDYVDAGAILAALGKDDLQDACDTLVDLALRAGAPDNVTCIVADLLDGDVSSEPVLVGAATASPRTPAAGRLAEPAEPSEDDAGHHSIERRPRSAGRRLAAVALVVVILIAAAIGGFVVYLHHQWYVGESHGNVAIYQGVKGEALGHHLSDLKQLTGIPVASLPPDDQASIHNTISVSGRSGAIDKVAQLRSDGCGLAASTAPSPAPKRVGKKHRPKPSSTPTPPSWCPTTTPTASP